MGLIKKGLPMPKTLRNILVSSAMLLALLVLGGIIYTYFAAGSPPSDNSASIKTDTTAPAIKPTKPAANAKESAAIEFLSSPVPIGTNATISVKTLATSVCKISVVYNNVPSTDSGLSQKTAGDFGNVDWTWTVGTNVPTGKWPVTVTCAYNGRTAVVVGDLEVTSQ